ncbi:hypothetical protein KUTeg_003784 [Tegillarca granosa]|uniref:Uncharacterized protein n=1 Tax=Tegillarca granosa TaxID=220873 RepID=A0ABQ9FN37_TEGGR|nr:hypothetical protein KUTeg_003784 [Tegillarca granosa]
MLKQSIPTSRGAGMTICLSPTIRSIDTTDYHQYQNYQEMWGKDDLHVSNIYLKEDKEEKQMWAEKM